MEDAQHPGIEQPRPCRTQSAQAVDCRRIIAMDSDMTTNGTKKSLQSQVDRGQFQDDDVEL